VLLIYYFPNLHSNLKRGGRIALRNLEYLPVTVALEAQMQRNVKFDVMQHAKL
jgi:hypothetical protein